MVVMNKIEDTSILTQEIDEDGSNITGVLRIIWSDLQCLKTMPRVAATHPSASFIKMLNVPTGLI